MQWDATRFSSRAAERPIDLFEKGCRVPDPSCRLGCKQTNHVASHSTLGQGLIAQGALHTCTASAPSGSLRSGSGLSGDCSGLEFTPDRGCGWSAVLSKCQRLDFRPQANPALPRTPPCMFRTLFHRDRAKQESILPSSMILVCPPDPALDQLFIYPATPQVASSLLLEQHGSSWLQAASSDQSFVFWPLRGEFHSTGGREN